MSNLLNNLDSLRDPTVGGVDPGNDIDMPEGEVSFSSAMAEEVLTPVGQRATDMIEHADKAQDIAEGLTDLAEKADELAAEDKEHAYVQTSLEGLHREFGLWMQKDNLAYKATSFESEAGTRAQAAGLAKDCRRIAASATARHYEVLNYSPEGAIARALGLDNFKLNNTIAFLTTAVQELENHKRDFKDGVVFSFNVFYAVMQRKNAQLIDVYKEFSVDEAWLKSASDYTTQYLEALPGHIKDGSVPSFDVSKVATDARALLGNAEVDQNLKYHRNPVRSEISKARNVGGAVRAGVLVGIFMGPAMGMAAAVTKFAIDHNLSKDYGGSAIYCSPDDLVKVAKGLIGMRGTSAAILAIDKGLINNALKQAKVDNPEAYKKGQEELKKAVRAIDAMHDHIKFMVLSLGHLVHKALVAVDDNPKAPALTNLDY